jgi:hypothetical protein
MRSKVELIDVMRKRLEAGGIGTSVEISLYLKARASSGGADKVEYSVVIGKGLARPVFADFAEETVFGGVPFGGSCGKVANGDWEVETIAEKALEMILPEITWAIAAAGVGEDEKLGGIGITNTAIATPPGTNGRDGEGGGIVRSADENGAAIVKDIVDAIGDGVTCGPWREVVVIDKSGRGLPTAARVLEVADKLSFLRVNADDRKVLTGELFTHGLDVEELLIAIGGGDGRDLLLIGA